MSTDHDVEEDGAGQAGSPPSGGRMRRVAGGRHQVVFVRLSETEAMVLAARAAAAGVSRQRYLVAAAVDQGPTVSERRVLYRELMGARRSVMGGMTNLNQIAKVANTTGRVPEQLGSLARSVDQAASALEVALARLAGEAGL